MLSSIISLSKASIFLASLAGLTAVATGQQLVQYCEDYSEGLGLRLALLGDVNGDGVGDFAMSSPRGAVQGFSGADLVKLYDFDIGVGTSSITTGSNVVSIGDMNGDGIQDFVVSNVVITSLFMGTLDVRSGATGAVLQTWSAPPMALGFGISMAPLGDIDGDGIPDLAVGSTIAQSSIGYPGGVFALSGANGSTIWSTFGEQNLERFGQSVAQTGDVNGDGFTDLIVGAQASDLFFLDGGRVVVLSGFDGTELLEVAPVEEDQHLGIDVFGVGDLDGDGIPEMALASKIGSFLADTDPIRPRVEIHSGATGANLFTVPGQVQTMVVVDTRMSAANIGDINLDGIEDFAVGDSAFDPEGVMGRGRVQVFSGSDFSLLTEYGPTSTEFGIGYGLAMIGDISGDAIPDVLYSAPNYVSRIHCLGVLSGNTSIASDGCPGVPNSTNEAGRLFAFGSMATSDQSLRLSATQIPSNQLVLFVGAEQTGFVSMPGGSQGNLCLDHPIFRYNAQSGMSVDGLYTADIPMTPADGYLPIIQAGQTWYFQAWHREFVGTSNFTGSASVTFL